MARKQKHSDDDYIIDANSSDLLGAEDFLAQKNADVLSSFGSEIRAESQSALSRKPAEGKPLSPLEKLKLNMMSGSGPEQSPPAAEPVFRKETEEKKPDMSLLEKLKRYTTDESGHNVTEDESPLYKLESVAQIIKSRSDSFIDKLSEKYDVTVDTLGKPGKDDYLLKGIEEQNEPDAKPDAQPEELPPENTTATPAFKKMSSESKKRFEKSIFDELFPEEKAENKEPLETVADISDIDIPKELPEEGEPEGRFDTATIRFTPVMDKEGNTGRINISSATKVIDINKELGSAGQAAEPAADTAIEVSDFDLFAPKDEITDISAEKATVRKLARKKRRHFLSCAVCSLCSFILLLFLLPFLADKVISSTKGVITFCSVVLAAAIAANADMFGDIAGLFRKKAGHDCMYALCALCVLPLCIIAAVKGENIYYLILLSSILMFTRALAAFTETSVMLSNLRQIRGARQKNAVSFIKDNSVARAMAKDSIDGDVLIAAPRKTQFVSDFIKYSRFKKKLSGRIPVLFVITLVLAALGAAMSAVYYKNAFSAVYAVSATATIAAMPALAFIDVLPLFAAAKKLNKKGAMIAGTYGADTIELANAAVIKTSDIFPAGSIVLKNFKVLSNNDIDKTIVNAAALTEAIGSPLAPVFNKIAGTNTSYKKPDSDTIKYEERLGISGWVDNELLFIGNRTLLQAHGIEVPSIEVDKRILKSGYFPVYVATANAACALIVIQYVVRSDIQKTLRKISKLGITMLLDNTDPNVTEDMVCDYFGLYDDSVKVMTNVGVYMCKNATAEVSTLSAPASFSGSALSLLKIMNCASGIRISNKILSVYYILALIIGIWYFAFSSFAVSGGLLSGLAILLFELLSAVIGVAAFLIKKP